jgi:hypothetical protein
MSKYGKCDEGFPILEDFVCQAIPGSPNVAGIKVGDRVRDQSGSLGTVMEVDTKANHGLGHVRVRFDDGREQIVALENGSLKKLEEQKGDS